MKVILTCDTGLPRFSWLVKTVLASLSQLPRRLRLGWLATEAEFLLLPLAIPPPPN
jgi:hypothetical protein